MWGEKQDCNLQVTHYSSRYLLDSNVIFIHRDIIKFIKQEILFYQEEINFKN